MLNRIAFLLAALSGAAIAGAQKPTDGDLGKELSTLQSEFSKAQDIYYEPYESAKTEEESAKVHLDPAKNPARVFLPKAVALAERAKGNQSIGPDAENFVIMLATQGADNATAKAAAKASLDRLMSLYIKSPKMGGRTLYSIQQANNLILGYGKGAQAATLAALTKIQAESPIQDVQAAALYGRADMLSSHWNADTDPVAGKKLFQELIAKYPKTRYVELAKGAMFEIDNLQVGMTAPDFEIEDQNGAKWKLSDYRGKVVVLDFWGFW